VESNVVADIRKNEPSKNVVEMLGEFFREASVLILVFYPIEIARSDGGRVPLPFAVLIGFASLGALLIGIALEKIRRK
jgi:hypothetical protein